MNKQLYIAYGSNLNISQMRRRCPFASILGTSKIKDYQLLFKGSKSGSYLTIEKSKGKEVPVAIWEVTEYDISRLDIYEGYPDFYYKKEMTIEVNNKTRKAFVYIMHEDRPLGIPSKIYVETCIEGYKDFDFDEKYLKEALLISFEEADNENNSKRN